MFGFLLFLYRKERVPANHGTIFVVITMVVFISVLVCETKFFVTTQEQTNQLESTLIYPIGFVKDSNETVFVYRDDSLKTVSIKNSELKISPDKVKIWSYPIRIVQQKD
jgi:hypothetical protein